MAAPAAIPTVKETATVALAVLAYVVAVLLVPLAAVVVLVGLVVRKLDSSDGEGSPSMVWAFAVMAAAMVINIAVLPPCLVWGWMVGKPSPPSPQYGSDR